MRRARVSSRSRMPGGFQVGDGAVGEVAPARDLTGDVVGDAADGEVRVGVRYHDGHLRAGIYFAGAQRCADPGVAAADRNDVHVVLIRLVRSLPCGRFRAVGLLVIRRLVFVRDDDPGGLSRGERGIQHPDEEHPGDAAADLGGDEHRADAGAIPAKVSENIRPIVIAGLAKLVEEVNQ